MSKGILASETESERTEKFATTLLISLIPIIVGGAVYSYVSGVRPEASPLGIAVAIGAVIAMPILWVQKRGIGRKADILPLSIDAVESATCFFMSIALLGGLLVNYFAQIYWSDYVATAIILGFVAYEVKESLQQIEKGRD